jgi:rubrerythrin
VTTKEVTMAVFEASQALEMAMKIEENGEAFYKAAAEKSDDAEIVELFEDLAARERRHYEVFKDMAQEVGPPPEPSGEEIGDYASFLKVALDHAVFVGPDKALRMAEEARDRKAVLRAAMGLEKDTMLFYYDLREMVADVDRATVSDIINEEKQHLRRLAKMAQ